MADDAAGPDLRGLTASPDQDRGDRRPGVVRPGRAAAADRGRRQRLPAQLLARHARGASAPSRRRSEPPAASWAAEIGVLQDLCGPKIRLGPIPGDVVECPLGDEFTLVADRTVGRPARADLHLPRAAGRPQGRRDGPVRRRHRGHGRDRGTAPGRARLKVTLAGPAAVAAGAEPARLGPGRRRRSTDKDLHDLDWTARHATSRVRRPVVRPHGADDVARLRRELAGAELPRPDRRQDREAAGGRSTSTRSSRRPTP